MNGFFWRLGDVAGVAGLIMCLLSGAARLFGHYFAFGLESNSVFLAGVGIMVAACLAKLHSLRPSR